MTPRRHDNDNGAGPGEADLQAYVDGQAGGRRRSAIEAYLATKPGEAARLAAYRDQNIGLHALFDPLIKDDAVEMPPAMAALVSNLQSQLDRDARAPRPPRNRYRCLAAGIAVLLTAGAAGWLAFDHAPWRQDPLVALTRQASETPLQLASSAPPATTTATQNSRPKVATWLAAQPGGAPARLPNLEALGFERVTERVITTAGGRPAAQLLYQDDSGQRVTLYMRAGGTAGGTAGQITFTFARDGESSQFLWEDSRMAYSLVGRMAQDKLLRIAEAVNDSLGGRSPEQAPPQRAAPPATLEPAIQRSDDKAAAPPVESAAPAPKIDETVDPGIESGQPLPLSLPERIEVPKET
ncbi:MAG: hypothetical protein RH942_08265 [Kiloniellaceae bacterium]